MDDAVDKNETEASQVLDCGSTVEEVEKVVCEQVPLENKGEVESLGTICDLENTKSDLADGITPPEEDKLELSILSEVADDTHALGCQTPRESIFDPFAPGPEEAACAPKKKAIRVTEVPSRRQLNFESGDYPVKRLSFDFDDSDEEDDRFLHGISKMFLDLIISNQSLEATGKDLLCATSPESCKTPLKPLFTGIADSCPDAPLRSSFKVVKLSPSICRKLDFDSVSP